MKRWKGLALGALALLLMAAQPAQAAEEAAPATRVTTADLKAARAEARPGRVLDVLGGEAPMRAFRRGGLDARFPPVSRDFSAGFGEGAARRQ